MPPQGQQQGSWVLYESDLNKDATPPPLVPPSAEKREWKIVWRNVTLFVLLHLGGVYGAYLFLTQAMWTTRIFAVLLYLASGLGITAGAHRLWAHKSYKARLPLRILLTIFNTIAFQDSVLDWARDHRMHHKYSETDADPHNATRGFFFSHVGWLLVRKHPEIKAKGHTIDMNDLKADPVLRFQKNTNRKQYDEITPTKEDYADKRKTFILDSDTNSTTNGSSPRNSSIFSHEKNSLNTSDTEGDSGPESAPVVMRHGKKAPVQPKQRYSGDYSMSSSTTSISKKPKDMQAKPRYLDISKYKSESSPKTFLRRDPSKTYVGVLGNCEKREISKGSAQHYEMEQKKQELEKWKRRASYDPRKAAASGKNKPAPKSARA